METQGKWLSLDEVAEYLRTDAEAVREMVRKRQIPYSTLPVSETPIFSTRSLDRWLHEREVRGVGGQDTCWELETDRKTLLERIKNRVRVKTVDRLRYVNLYARTRVFAQLHEPSDRLGPSYDGVCIAIPEAASDENRPELETLTAVAIDELSGYWKANKDWLKGNGHRFTQYPAVAFHVPLELAKDAGHPAWSEVDRLLEYAFEKIDRS